MLSRETRKPDLFARSKAVSAALVLPEMQADMDALEPLMKDEAEKRETFGHKLKMTALGGTGFNVRNPVTGGISSWKFHPSPGCGR